MNSPTYTTDRLGNANSAIDLEADSNMYLTVADSAAISPTSAATIAMWIKPESMAQTAYIVYKWNAVANRSYYIALSTAGIMRFQVDSYGDNSATTACYAQDAVSNGSWYHVAAIATGTKLYWYVNGKKQSEYNHTNGIFDGTADLVIGRLGTASDDYDGLIDDLVIRDYAMTQDQIMNLMGVNGESIYLDHNPEYDLIAYGVKSTVTVDTNSTGFGACLGIAADGHYDEASSAVCQFLALQAGTGGDNSVLKSGTVRNDAWNWTVGDAIYVSSGGATVNTSGTQVGRALSADVIYFEGTK